MRISIIIILSLLLPSGLTADEGMWLPFLLNDSQIELMHKKGLEIPFESVYSHSKPSIKDAIVSLDDGACTAEFISNKGLLLTNHHCGYNEIQHHSSIKHNYLKNGFWANSLEEELANPGKTATLLIEAHDVTNSILPQLINISGTKRALATDSLITALEEEHSQLQGLDASIKPIFNGNKYILFLTKTFKDVRLVGTPPSSIGKFGGDTDNWMWPRHTGDFSFFRVYCAPDGSPAEYSKDNIPFTPKHHLKINLNGVNKGDFTMTLGYPGTTDRYLTSFGIKEVQNTVNPIVAEVRGIKQNIWQQAMSASPELNIKYTAKYSESSNYWKYAIGQNKALDQLSIVEDREIIEQTFTDWYKNDSLRTDSYGKALPIIEASYLLSSKLTLAETIIQETMLEGAEILMFALEITASFMELEEYDKNNSEYNLQLENTISTIKLLYKDYDANLDQEVFAAMLNYYINHTPKNLRPSMEELFGKKYKENPAKFIDHLYNNTAITNSNEVIKLLRNGDEMTMFEDPAIAFSYHIISHLYQLLDVHERLNSQYKDAQRLFVKGYMKMHNKKHFYPDANSTLRLSYGKVGDYEPNDGITYKYQTTLSGIIEKEDTSNIDFIVPQELKDIYNTKNFGEYGQPNGKMPICFLSDNDITGGNSGSPVIDKNGNLIGVAFDGNWEAMTSDLAYEEKLQKCICVDIRYVLLVVDKMANAQRLINEMDIIR